MPDTGQIVGDIRAIRSGGPFVTSVLPLFLTVCGLVLGLEARAETVSPSETGGEDGGRRALSRTTRYITATVASPRPIVIAGEQGELLLELSVASQEIKDGPGRFRWNRNSGPVTIRIVASEESGITFEGDEGSPSKEWRRETELGFQIKNEEGVVPVTIPYAVSSRVRVKEHPLRLFVSGELITEGGDRLQDSGIVTLPVRVETPLRVKLLVLFIIAVAIFLFIVDWVRVDVVAILIMVSLPMLNLLGSRATFTGLSSNAVIAIIGVMIVSAGLNKVGLVSRMVKPVIRMAGNSSARLMVFVSSLIALISSVMQNTGAAVLFLPGIRHACKEIKIPISSVLMPIGMCAILGGTMTMVGTSPLILLNDILPDGMEKFSFLELTPIGFALVLGGLIYFSTVGKLFLGNIARSQARPSNAPSSDDDPGVLSYYHDLDGPFELHIPADYIREGEMKTVEEVLKQYHTNIVAVAHGTGVLHELAPTPDTKLRSSYSLCAYGEKTALKAFADELHIEILDGPHRFKDLFNPAVAGTIEAGISPHSTLIGSTIREIGFRRTFGMTVLALFREGKTYYDDLVDTPLTSGDALLLHSTWERFRSFEANHRNFIITTPLEVEIQKPRKVKAAVFCFLCALTLMFLSSFYFQSMPYNPIPLSVCLMAGGIGMVLTRVLSIQEAYAAVDWRTVFLLGGLIPLGMAVDQTGTAEWLASGIVSALGDAVTPLLLITVLAVMSGAFCLVISNVGACTLLVPLGVSMAYQIGVDPRVAAIVVGIGVSNSFLLPTHQVNALYMGPGEYRTRDYIKIGGVMSAIYVAILVAMTYVFYM